MKAEKDDIGRNVIFRAICRWGAIKTTRKIRDVWDNGRVIVRYGGYKEFQVRPEEIIEIY